MFSILLVCDHSSKTWTYEIIKHVGTRRASEPWSSQSLEFSSLTTTYHLKEINFKGFATLNPMFYLQKYW